MEHKFDDSNILSIIGSFITITFSWMWHVGKEDILFIMAVISFLVTVGYTCDKWYRMRKGKKTE